MPDLQLGTLFLSNLDASLNISASHITSTFEVIFQLTRYPNYLLTCLHKHNPPVVSCILMLFYQGWNA